MKPRDQRKELTIRELRYDRPNTTVIWILAHQGIEENEKTATAAREATAPSFTDRHVPIPCEDQINYCEKIIKNEWNNTWTKSTHLHKCIRLQTNVLAPTEKIEPRSLA